MLIVRQCAEQMYAIDVDAYAAEHGFDDANALVATADDGYDPDNLPGSKFFILLPAL